MHQPGPSGAYARIKAGTPLVHVVDLIEGEVYRTSPLRQALVDLGDARTGIIIALRKDETLLGVLTIPVKPMSSFLPSGVTPMMTRMHCACVDAVGPAIDVALC
jgi:hypothetical protein